LIKDGRYYIKDQFVDGRKIMSGVYNSVDPWTEDGPFIYYDRDGKVYAEGSVNNGNMIGNWIYYTNDLTDTVDYNPVWRELERIKSKREKENKVPESNPLASDTLLAYMQSHVHFPARIKILQSSGNVKMTVTVNNHERIPVIYYSDHPDFDLEAIRILLSAPESICNVSGQKSLTYNMEVYFATTSTVEYPVTGTIPDTAIDPSEPQFVFVEEQAMFQGGSLDQFRQWVQQNLSYPADAVQKGQSGRITIQFSVSSKGKVGNVKILRGSGVPSLDNEAVRLILSSPIWKPARQKGSNVAQQFVMPIIFYLP
jgi:TonB family protein